MHRAIHTATLVLALAAQAGNGGCEVHVLPQACDVKFRGIQVDQGYVTDVVTPVCDEPPQRHLLHAWIEYRRVGEYARLGRQRDGVTDDLPDREGKTKVTLTVRDCVEGWYRSAAHVEGVGPVSSEYPQGLRFDAVFHGASEYLSVADCEEG